MRLSNTRTGMIFGLACSAALAAPISSAAEDPSSLAFTVSYLPADTDRHADFGMGVGAHLGLPLNRLFELELTAFAASFERKEDENHDWQYGGGLDLLLSPNGHSGFRYYGLAGLGVVSDDSRGVSDTGPYLNTGAGLVIPVHHSGLGLRAEGRFIYSFVDSTINSEDTLQDFKFTVGLDIPLGGGSSRGHHPVTNSVGDSDLDGVMDTHDRCPGSPPGHAVNVYGCSLDDDGDGVPNRKDACSNTPQGNAVDAIGCPTGVLLAPPAAPQGTAASGSTITAPATGAAVAAPAGPDQCPNTHPDIDEDPRGCASAGQTVELPGIRFNGNGTALNEVAQQQLDQVISMMQGQPGMMLEVTASATGSNAERLRIERAISVKEYMISKGISANRLAVVGNREGNPVSFTVIRP